MMATTHWEARTQQLRALALYLKVTGPGVVLPGLRLHVIRSQLWQLCSANQLSAARWRLSTARLPEED